MKGNNYLIPANSKKSQLILSIFTPVDLGILIIGILISVALLLTVSTNEIMPLIGLSTPALIAIFLVLPVPNYHNVRTLIRNMYRYLTGRKKYYWRGWCACYGNRKSEYGDSSNN